MVTENGPRVIDERPDGRLFGQSGLNDLLGVLTPEETEMTPVIYISDSYAGTYRLEYLGNGWKRLFMNGKEVGAFLGRGGVYAAATFFKV